LVFQIALATLCQLLDQGVASNKISDSSGCFIHRLLDVDAMALSGQTELCKGISHLLICFPLARAKLIHLSSIDAPFQRMIWRLMVRLGPFFDGVKGGLPSLSLPSEAILVLLLPMLNQLSQDSKVVLWERLFGAFICSLAPLLLVCSSSRRKGSQISAIEGSGLGWVGRSLFAAGN
jgi:hypothetical protein